MIILPRDWRLLLTWISYGYNNRMVAKLLNDWEWRGPHKDLLENLMAISDQKELNQLQAWLCTGGDQGGCSHALPKTRGTWVAGTREDRGGRKEGAVTMARDESGHKANTMDNRSFSCFLNCSMLARFPLRSPLENICHHMYGKLFKQWARWYEQGGGCLSAWKRVPMMTTSASLRAWTFTHCPSFSTCKPSPSSHWW